MSRGLDFVRVARWCAAIATVGLMGFGFAPTAMADEEPENETLAGAEGPLTTDVEYVGKMGHPQDESDWYFFYAGPQVELTITSSVSGCEDHHFSMKLYGRNAAGFEAGEDGELGWDSVITYTTPPGTPRLYYLKFRCRPSDALPNAAYTFEITANVDGALIPGEREFGAPLPLGEPNETPEQAVGPLVGGVTYQGATTTSNDEDWFYFYMKPQQTIEIAVTTADLDCDFEPHSEMRFEPEHGSSSETSLFVHGVHRLVHRSRSFSALERHKLSVKACPLSSYLFKITPADAVASQACAASMTAETNLSRRLARLLRNRRAAKRRQARKVRRMTRRKRAAKKRRARRQIGRALRRSKGVNRRRVGKLTRRVRKIRGALGRYEDSTRALCG